MEQEHNFKIAVVIPNWNGENLLDECLKSLHSQSQSQKIIVVDNGSTDNSVSLVENKYPEVSIIKLDKNHGFAGGVNAGIQQAMKFGAEFIALLNNDAAAELDWLKNLYQTAEKHPEAGIVTSKIILWDKKHLDSTGDFYSVWGLPFPRGRNQEDKLQYDDLKEVFAASGGASLYSVSMLKQIGLFDEDFFAYFEDVDISFRAQLAGWKVRYEPSAIVYHRLNATSSRLGSFSLYHSSKNFMLVYAKNMPTKLYIKYLPFFSLQLLRWFITSTLRGHMITFLKGIFAALRLHFSTTKKRKLIQSSSKVKVKYIDEMLYHHRPPKPPTLESL